MIDWLYRKYREWKWRRHTEWAHVPPPEWRAKRSGRDYW